MPRKRNKQSEQFVRSALLNTWDYTDYEATIDFSKIPKTVEVGFKYEPFEDIIWNQLSEEDEWFKKL